MKYFSTLLIFGLLLTGSIALAQEGPGPEYDSAEPTETGIASGENDHDTTDLPNQVCPEGTILTPTGECGRAVIDPERRRLENPPKVNITNTSVRSEGSESEQSRRSVGSEMTESMPVSNTPDDDDTVEEPKEMLQNRIRTSEQPREQQREAVRERRGNVVQRLAQNITIRLESAMRRMSQIHARAQVVVDDLNANGSDMTMAQMSLDAAETSLETASTHIGELALIITTWAEFDVTSDDFREELNNQKEAIRASMLAANEAVREAARSIRDAIGEIKSAQSMESLDDDSDDDSIPSDDSDEASTSSDETQS